MWKCKCKKHWKSSEDVTMDIMNYGFMPDYYVWRCHGEEDVSISTMTHGSSSHGGQRPEHQSLEQMVVDIAGIFPTTWTLTMMATIGRRLKLMNVTQN